MHDDLLERRLRATLRDEADRQPFTISAAELERRVTLRGRNAGGRRLTLLLAAAVAIGALGVGGLAGGILEGPDATPDPTHPANAAPSPSAGPIAKLPSLDDVMSFARGDAVAMAQAHDLVDRGGTVSEEVLPERHSVALGTLAGSSRYQLTVACLGSGAAAFDIRLPGSRGLRDGPEVECDGAFYEQPIEAVQPQAIQFDVPRSASWRVVIKRLDGPPREFPGDPATLARTAGQEAFVEAENQRTEGGFIADGPSGLSKNYGALPGRLHYMVHGSCVGGDAIRYALGDIVGAVIVANTTTLVPCDGLEHVVWLGTPEPSGAQVFVTADPSIRFSLLVTSEQAPVSLFGEMSGWQVVAGIGPEFAFDTTAFSFSALSVNGGGALRVALDCFGPGSVEVEVDLHQSIGSGAFVARCSEIGIITSQDFDAESYEAVRVEYGVAPGQWTALSLLVPDEALLIPDEATQAP